MHIEKEIEVIKNRNKKVELDKAWETSYVRRIIIALLTYITIVSFFLVADLPNPFINSLVPTIGYTLSTMSLPYVKKIYLKFLSERT